MSDDEKTTEETPVEEQAEEPTAEAADEAPAEEPPAEEAPAEEPAAEEAPAEEPTAEEAPTDEPAAEEASAGEAPADEEPAVAAVGGDPATARVFLTETGYRVVSLWSEPEEVLLREGRHGGLTAEQLYPVGNLPEKVQRALNPLKASKKNA